MEITMNLLDRIDAIRANSVSDQEFDKTWGTSLDRHLEIMMEHVLRIDERIKAERASKGQQD